MDNNFIDADYIEQVDFGPLASDAVDDLEPIGGEHLLRRDSGMSRLQDWMLICPPDNWRDAIPIDLGELRLLEVLTQRIDLVITRDDKRKKLYLSCRGAPAQTGRLVLGDPGVELDDANESDPNNKTEQTPNEPPAGQNEPPARQNEPSAGVGFGSGWVASVIPDSEAGPEYRTERPDTAAPLISAFPDHQISKNFRLSEFRPGDHSYDLIRLSPMLVNILEEIRKRAGGYPLHINSSYRPPAYNRKIGGVSNSFHLDGLAADISSDNISTEALRDICERVIGDRGGLGYYPTDKFIHVDLRGYPARW